MAGGVVWIRASPPQLPRPLRPGRIRTSSHRPAVETPDPETEATPTVGASDGGISAATGKGGDGYLSLSLSLRGLGLSSPRGSTLVVYLFGGGDRELRMRRLRVSQKNNAKVGHEHTKHERHGAFILVQASGE
jgi:hypothetical protein